MGTVDAEQINAALRGFDRLYGLELLSCSDTEVRARVRVRDELKQPAGLVHGGVYASIAESMASLATALAVFEHGEHGDGPVEQHELPAPDHRRASCTRSATRVHRGRTTWVWDVRFSDDADHTCAVTRMTIAVRPRRTAARLAGARRRYSSRAGAAARAPARAAAFRRSRCSAAPPAAALRARRAR